MKNARIRGSVNESARNPQGIGRLEHLFALKQALGAFDFVGTQLAECDREIDLRSSAALQPSASSTSRRRQPSDRHRRDLGFS